MIIYYILSISALAALIIYAPEHLIFNFGSLCVAFTIALMAFMSVFYKKHHNNDNSETTYGSHLTAIEQIDLFKLMSFSYQIYIPLCLPFFFFLIQWKKIAAVVILYLLASITGPFLYRIKHGKGTKKRLTDEKTELQEQIRKESDRKM